MVNEVALPCHTIAELVEICLTLKICDKINKRMCNLDFILIEYFKTPSVYQIVII